MGLFGFGNNKKIVIQNMVTRISTGLNQINEELRCSGGQSTPMIEGILSAMQNDSRTLYNTLSPNGRTDWSLVKSTTVKDFSGKEMDIDTFVYRLYNEGMRLYELTGINIAFSL